MSDFLKKPNLPDGEVASLICGGLNEELIDYFKSRDIEVFYTAENKSVCESVAFHADISVLYLGDGKIIIDKGQPDLSLKMKEIGLSVAETAGLVSGAYPNDCILNHTLVGGFLIGNSKIFDPSVKKHCSNMEEISVKQGYCKCSVLVVDENSIITDDGSIARKAAEKGLECLLVSKGDISLSGHEYGFIGGASGKISKDEIIFFGDVTRHRDYVRIKDFLDKRGIRIISFDFPLTDFGGIIPIKENK